MQHHLHLEDVVAVHAVCRRGEAEPAALHEAADADGLAFAARNMQPVSFDGAVEGEERAAGSDDGRLVPDVDGNRVEPLDVDEGAGIRPRSRQCNGRPSEP